MESDNQNTSHVEIEPEWFKAKIQTIWSTSQFCGLCLETSGQLCSVETELLIRHQEISKSLQDIINYVFNDDVDNFMSSLLICDVCLEKAIQSYIFIHNSKQLSKVVNNCVNDIYSKVVDVNNQLDCNVKYNNSNVMIVLEHDPELNKHIIDTKSMTEIVPVAAPVVKKPIAVTIAEENKTSLPLKPALPFKKIVKDQVEDKKEKTPNISLKDGKIVVKPLSLIKTTAIPHYNTYECSDCSEIFTSYRSLKEHEKAKHKFIVYRCKFCDKCYNTQQYLNIHYKKHQRERCKICRAVLPEDEIMDHLKKNHPHLIYGCTDCDLVYYSQESMETHYKISHFVVDTKNKTQCIMCLRNFMETELKTHRCKFSCSECFDMPCIHYKYLMSYREQVLNHSNQIKCMDCDYLTRRKEHLIGHVNREHLDHHPFTCADCGQQFYTKLSLKTHIAQYHQDLCCEFCDFEFKDPNTLETHKKACKLVVRSILCSKCVASFDSVDDLLKHENLRHGAGHPCRLCKCKFLTKMELEEHHARVHGGIQCKKRRKHIECTLCDEFFKNLKELVEHEKLHNPSEEFPCKICPKQFKSLRKLYVHNQKHYTKRIKCPGCNKKVAASFYPQHAVRCPYKTSSAMAKENVCEVCGKSFHLESLLRIHQKMHLDPEPCPHCKKLLKPNSLKRHMELVHGDTERTITVVKPIECEVCGHVVRKNSDLDAHMNRYHLKIKPYVCNVCNRAFCGKARLKEHLSTHTSDNDCYCSICGKKFANRVCLKMHLRIHTGEAPYPCDLCGQRFRSSSMMKTHRLKKHLQKTVSCPLCDSMFYIIRDMRLHFKKVHWKFKDKPFDPRQVPELSEEFYHLFEDGRLPKLE